MQPSTPEFAQASLTQTSKLHGCSFDNISPMGSTARPFPGTPKRYLTVRDPLHNSSRFVIRRARAACCVVFLVNSQLLTAKRRLASHPDPSATFSRELCSKSLKQFLQSALTTLYQVSIDLLFQCLASCAECPQTARDGAHRQSGRAGVRRCLVQTPCRGSSNDAGQQLWGGCQSTVGLWSR